MNYNITFQIECGEKTCAVKKGKFCQYLNWTANNKNRCFFFGEVYDKDGWVQRHPTCIKGAEKVG
jgi:hypothetical protein